MKFWLQTPTPDLEASRAFFRSLDFIPLDEHQEWFSDGMVCLHLNANRTARAGLVFSAEASASINISAVQSHVPLVQTSNGLELNDYSGMRVILSQLASPTIARTSKKSLLGNPAGISLEAPDIAQAAALYSLLGFEHHSGSMEGSYVTLERDELLLSIMKADSCPHLFFNPSLTYFNGTGNAEIIRKVRTRKIPITEEITVFDPHGEVSNIILRDPGGLGFFLFNDG